MSKSRLSTSRIVTSTMAIIFAIGLATLPVLATSDFQHFDAGDYDGDGLADAIALDNGDWYAWLSGSNYQISTNMPDLAWTGGAYAMADFDGDRLVDCAMTVESQWYFWFSSSQYTNQGPYDLGISGSQPLAGDFDGDGKADPVMVMGNSFYTWLSGSGYPQVGPIIPGFGIAEPVCGDLDGDGLADFASLDGQNWSALLSGAGYQAIGPLDLGILGLPVVADFDGDGKDDLATCESGAEEWSILLSSTGYQKIITQLGGGRADTVAALVIAETNAAYAFAYISDGYLEITNAVVRANNSLLAYGLDMIITNASSLVSTIRLPIYHGQVAGVATGSTVKITATNSAGVTIYQSDNVVIPNQVSMTAPTNNQPLTLNQDVNVSWTQVPKAGAYIVSYLAPAAEDTGVEYQGSYSIYLPSLAAQATVPGTNTQAGEAWFEVAAMAGDEELLNGSTDITNSFLIVATTAESETEITASASPRPDLAGSEGLSIIKQYEKNIEGLKFKIQEGNPAQIQQAGTVSLSFKLRRLKMSVAFVKAYNMNGQEIFSWEKKRIFKSHDKKYHVNFGVGPGTTVVIGTHDANYRGGTYSY